MSALNGILKSNAKVSPIDEDAMNRLSKEELNNTHIAVPKDPAASNQDVVKTSFIHRLFKKEKKEKQLEIKKKPEGPKLKKFEIVCIISIVIISYLFLFSISLPINGIFSLWLWVLSQVHFKYLFWIFFFLYECLFIISFSNWWSNANNDVVISKCSQWFS
jgi:hypothetical protein